VNKEINLNISYENGTNIDDNFVSVFTNSIVKLFSENYSLLEAIRLSEAENPIVEWNTINNNEVMTVSDIRMRFCR